MLEGCTCKARVKRMDPKLHSISFHNSGKKHNRMKYKKTLKQFVESKNKFFLKKTLQGC